MKIMKVLLLGFILLQVSCTSFIEVDTPKNQLLTNDVYSNDETATATMVAIYTKMVDDYINYDIPMLCGYASDELTCYSDQQPLLDIFFNAPRAQDAYSNNLWNRAFFYIFQANSVIEGCQTSTHINTEVKKQLIAEAHFVRAFWMYYLTNFFGEIPLTLTTDYKINSKLQRANINDTYRQITTDLEFAIENLHPQYVDNTSRSITSERIRPNRYAAIALLARVKLTTRDWLEAEQLASIVIDQTEIYDTVSVNEVFLRDNKEAIWQLMQPTPRVSDISTVEGYGFVLIARPNTAHRKNSTVSNWLIGAFEQGDLRYETWIGKFEDSSTNAVETYFYPNKYKISNASGSIIEQSTVLRLAEQYLIRAEAHAQQGNFDESLRDINIIRKRANLPPISSADKEFLLRTIFHERQIEFFSEWGHRWIDLKRMGYINEIMPDVLELKQNRVWNSFMELWPIPQTDIERNINLSQNAGYN